MGRRRKRDDDWIGLVAQLAGMMFLLSLISPKVRHTISAIGFIAICLLGVFVFGVIAFGVYRWVTRSQRAASSSTSDLVTRTDLVKAAVSIRQVESARLGSVPHTTAELLEQLRSIDWFQFEKLVALAYRKIGYTVTRRGGANPDGGIDLVIDKDGDRSAVQCKQWKTWNVGVKAVREFLGALTDARIEKGIFITLCGYTGEAKKLAEKHGIEIINETGLAQILESMNVHLDPEVLAILRDTRKFCPKCESEMVLRTATKGVGAGKTFWGCSAFPKCRFTIPGV
jgi:restriction system protein